MRIVSEHRIHVKQVHRKSLFWRKWRELRRRGACRQCATAGRRVRMCSSARAGPPNRSTGPWVWHDRTRARRPFRSKNFAVWFCTYKRSISLQWHRISFLAFLFNNWLKKEEFYSDYIIGMSCAKFDRITWPRMRLYIGTYECVLKIFFTFKHGVSCISYGYVFLTTITWYTC